jgi:hypothetical protein
VNKFPTVTLPGTDTEKRDLLHEMRDFNRNLNLKWARALAYKITRDGSTLYMGTVPRHVKEKRRAAGKRAKAARKRNR